jgi:hypothetical protein
MGIKIQDTKSNDLSVVAWVDVYLNLLACRKYSN